MKLKVGDKLLCKKSITLVDKIEEGKYYEISHIRVDIEGYKMKNGWDVNELKKPGENVTVVWIGEVNYYYENNNHFSGYYLWDYFYTEKEIRKLKLNEIGH